MVDDDVITSYNRTMCGWRSSDMSLDSARKAAWPSAVNWRTCSCFTAISDRRHDAR